MCEPYTSLESWRNWPQKWGVIDWKSWEPAKLGGINFGKPRWHTGPISRGKIRTTLTQLKNAKAPGVDNIPPEALKEGGLWTVEALHRILNFVWEKEEIPDNRKRGLLVRLAKKGDLSLCGNWRGIMVLSIPSKVLILVKLNGMKVAVDEALRDKQAGFRKDRSCIDQIATLRIVVEQTIEW